MALLTKLSEPASLAIGILAVMLAWIGLLEIVKLTAVVVLEAILIAFSVLVHELAHRNVARRYRCYSKYVIDPIGLMLTLVSSISPFIRIIIPGYVLISCAGYWGDYGRNGNRAVLMSTIAGPLSNIVLGFIFYAISIAITSPLLKHVLFSISSLNGWLAFFNLLPLGPLDGARIIRGAPITWVIMFACSLALMIFA